MATTLILSTNSVRDKAVKWIRCIPDNSVVTFKKPSRSLAQNDRFWAMLTDIATQCKLNDRKLTPEQWKVVFLSALKHEQEFIQGLEGDFIPAGFKSSKLSKEQMSELMEYISAYGAEQGVTFKEPAQ